MRQNNIELDSDSVIKYGHIARSRLSDDETCFVDEETLAYTFTVSPSDINENHVNMYIEVNDSGVVKFVSES